MLYKQVYWHSLLVSVVVRLCLIYSACLSLYMMRSVIVIINKRIYDRGVRRRSVLKIWCSEYDTRRAAARWLKVRKRDWRSRGKWQFLLTGKVRECSTFHSEVRGEVPGRQIFFSRIFNTPGRITWILSWQDLIKDYLPHNTVASFLSFCSLHV